MSFSTSIIIFLSIRNIAFLHSSSPAEGANETLQRKRGAASRRLFTILGLDPVSQEKAPSIR